MDTIASLNSLNGFYRVIFRFGSVTRVGFVAVNGTKIVGCNADQPIVYSGNCTIDCNGLAVVQITPRNNSDQPVEMVTGAILYPGEEYVFSFTGTLGDLGNELTFRTPFGPVGATVELVGAL